MKRLFQAATLVTAGVAAMTSAAVAAEGGSKPWVASLAVKGFWDDNIFAAPDKVPGSQVSNPGKIDSVGFDVSPQIRGNFNFDQTTLSLGYQFGARWFEARDRKPWDLSHSFFGQLAHQFNPRYRVAVRDALSVAQEPEQFGVVAGNVVPFRSRGNNVINRAGIDFSAELTRQWSAVFSYDNNLFDFTDNGGVVGNPVLGRFNLSGYGPILNRMEHALRANLRYQLSTATIGQFGYEYGIYDYNNQRAIADNSAHYVFVGIDHSFTSQLIGSLRAGPEFRKFDGNGLTGDRSTVDPRAEASLKYTYAEGSYVSGGVIYRRYATDVIVDRNGSLNATAQNVTDAQTLSLFATVSHAITARLKGNVMGQFQHADYKFGGADASGTERYFGVGVGFSYQFTHWISGVANYYFDDRSAKRIYNGGLDYSRNRVFLGVNLTY